MITAIIVDDETLQQDTLLRMLGESFPDIIIAAVCSTVEDGMSKIKQLHPQLVFLDVELGPKTGFHLLHSLDEINFDVIFTTSHSKYAVDAFKVSAVDYLLKPFSAGDLQIAIDKFKKKMAMKQPYENIQTLLHNITVDKAEKTKIALPTLTGYVFEHASDITRCEADDHYTWFYLKDTNRKLVTKDLKDCEELLTGYNFLRVHLKHLINMSCIKEYIKGDGGIVIMTDGASIDVSRKKKSDFLNRLTKI